MVFRNVLHPARYHGYGQKPPFFEGWYFKLIDAEANARYAIIPGIVLSRDPAEEHAFIQVLDGLTGRVDYHRYPAALFWAARDTFEVRIGPNRFNRRFLELDIGDEIGAVRGKVRFEGVTPWPVSLRSPGVMGWYAWAPFMETYHGVVSLDHRLEGTLCFDGEEVDFSGGRGYIEKDWGQSFPAGYVWMQSNHFEESGTSFTASVAVVPWLTGAFAGFIIGFWHQGQLYRFASYTGATTERLEIGDKHVNWTVRDKFRRLQIRAGRASGLGMLRAPDRRGMGQRVGETMQATVEVALYEWTQQERLLFRGVGQHAGLEVYGEVERLLKMIG